MTKTKILTLLNEYLLNGSGLTLNEMKRSLEQDIRDENNKLNGSANIGKAMKAILKEQDIRIDLKTAFAYNNGTAACNGYQLLVTYEQVDIERNETAPIKLEPMIDQYHYVNMESVKTPTIGEVKSEQQLQKASVPKSKFQIFKVERADGQFVVLDCKYLLPMLTAIPDAKIQVSTDNLISPVWFNSPVDKTFGIVLPIRVSK